MIKFLEMIMNQSVYRTFKPNKNNYNSPNSKNQMHSEYPTTITDSYD